jgi:AraC-like DNA-binding protein
LNHRLRSEGTTFVALLAGARYKIARQLLRDTRMRLTDIATILGYSETASFCRAFQRWSGTTATAWRSAYGTRIDRMSTRRSLVHRP